jgi:hydrogenase maturation protease
VLGIGNLLWADEGFGVRCVEDLYRTHEVPPGVRLMDGGTQGLYLVQYVQRARNLLVFDAIDWGDPPGTLRVIRGDAVPRFLGAKKMSLHQTGFQDVLAAADLMGAPPEAISLVGIQAEELEDWCGSLRPAIKARMPDALALGLAELASWGVTLPPRAVPLSGRAGLVGHDMDLESYERREGAG